MDNFGLHLKEWRSKRRMSQLDLSVCADVSPRHIAFLETGRSKPSREMVLQLSKALTIPRTHRNILLKAAGYAAAYKSRDMSDEDMIYVRQAAGWMLERHDPYPAFVYDKYWTIVMANETAQRFLEPFGLGVGKSMIDGSDGALALRDMIDNWGDVAHHFAIRLRTESVNSGGDPNLDAAAEAFAKEAEKAGVSQDTQLDAVFSARYKFGNQIISVFSTVTQFCTAEDITLADLKIEMLFPSDEASKAALEEIGQSLCYV